MQTAVPIRDCFRPGAAANAAPSLRGELCHLKPGTASNLKATNHSAKPAKSPLGPRVSPPMSVFTSPPIPAVWPCSRLVSLRAVAVSQRRLPSRSFGACPEETDPNAARSRFERLRQGLGSASVRRYSHHRWPVSAPSITPINSIACGMIRDFLDMSAVSVVRG
jgi:hypothetical protein